MLSESYADRTAFILNANAKSVNDRVVNRLVNIVPAGDLFYSRTFSDAEGYLRTILRRGYGRIFSGGGDGTIVNTINMLRKIAKEEGITKLPTLGVLKLGTGNALANVVNAKLAVSDVHHVLSNGSHKSASVNMIECDDGRLTPFAGVGYDGELINDYVDVKRRFADSFFEQAANSVLGYLWAGFTKTIPRHLFGKVPHIRVMTTSKAYRVTPKESRDEEFEVKDGLLYEGPAPLISAGSIRCAGYGFIMFPFAERKDGYMHLRVSSIGLLPLIANLYPRVWRGTYRHPKLYDFLVKDVVIESEQPLPYQVAGDAAGYRKRLSFKMAECPIDMVQLPAKRLSRDKGIKALLPSASLARA